MDRRIFWAAILVGAIAIAPSASTEAQDAPLFYFVGEERVQLQISPNYRAFQLDGDPGSLASFASILPRSVTDQQPTLLDEYNILLFPRTAPVPFASIERSLEAARERPLPEAPVFWAAGADHVLINEFVVQFSAELEQDERTAILTAVGAEVIESPERIQGRYVVSYPSMGVLDALTSSNALHQGMSRKLLKLR